LSIIDFIPERIPDTVLRLDSGSTLSIRVVRRAFDRDALLTVYRVSGGQVFGNEQIFLGSSGDKDSGMTMWLNDDPLTTLRATSSPPTWTSTTPWSTLNQKRID
jgi:hypothetical protein